MSGSHTECFVARVYPLPPLCLPALVEVPMFHSPSCHRLDHVVWTCRFGVRLRKGGGESESYSKANRKIAPGGNKALTCFRCNPECNRAELPVSNFRFRLGVV